MQLVINTQGNTMKHYLSIVATFFSLSSIHLGWCHSEIPHEWPIAHSDATLAKVIDEQEASAAEASKKIERKRKYLETVVGDNNNNNCPTPDLYPPITDDDNNEQSTQKDSDSEREEIPDINERAPKVMKKVIKIGKTTINSNELSTLQKRVRRFNRRKRPLIAHIFNDNKPN